MVRIAVIGDIHESWDREDIDFFNGSSYDLLLFVGDLPARSSHNARRIAALIGEITRPAWLIPGNHDSTHLIQLVAEVLRLTWLNHPFAGRQLRETQAIEELLGGVGLCGYSLHPLTFPDFGFDLLAARPHSMGGKHLSFGPYLERSFGIETMEASAARLCQLVDRSQHEHILVLAHNGPTGLGEAKDDIWGADFGPGGDFGDPDLRVMLDYAQQQGKKLLAVVAGHMHHRVRGGGRRTWLVHNSQGLFVNAACVPRIRQRKGSTQRHHIALHIDGEGHCEVREVWVCGGQIADEYTHHGGFEP